VALSGAHVLNQSPAVEENPVFSALLSWKLNSPQHEFFFSGHDGFSSSYRRTNSELIHSASYDLKTWVYVGFFDLAWLR
jgi:hypothetical protein